MKTEKEVIIERLIGGATASGEAMEALAENRALTTLSAAGAEPPDRARLAAAAIADAESRVTKDKSMADYLTFHPARRRWLLQTAAVVLILTIIIGVVLFRPSVQRDPAGQVLVTPAHPAWAAEPGVLITRNLTGLDPAMAPALDRVVAGILREELAGTAVAPDGLAHELVPVGGGYRFRLALPAVDTATTERVQSRLGDVFAAYGALPEDPGAAEDILLLLENTPAERAPGRNGDWAPAREVPDLDVLAERLRSVFEQTGGSRHVSVDLDIVDGQVTMKLGGGDDGVEVIGPHGTYDGRDVMLLREIFEGETALEYTPGGDSPLREYLPDHEQFLPERRELDEVPDDGKYNYSYRYTVDDDGEGNRSVNYSYSGSTRNETPGGVSCSASSYTSSSSSSSRHSSSSSSSRSSSSSSSDSSASGGGGGGGSCGGGGGGNCGGGGSGGGNAAVNSDRTPGPDRPAGTGDAVGSDTPGAGFGGFELPGFIEDANGPFAAHYALLNDYISKTYGDDPVETSLRGSDGVLAVEIKHAGDSESFEIRSTDSGSVEIVRGTD